MPLSSSVWKNTVSKGSQNFASERVQPADCAIGLESAISFAGRAASHKADLIVLCSDASYTCCYDIVGHIESTIERIDRRWHCLPRTLRGADY